MRNVSKSWILATCTLSACALVGKMQTGVGGSTETTSGSSPSTASSSGYNTPSAPSSDPGVSVASGGSGSFCGAHHYGKRTAKELHAWFDDPKDGRYTISFLVKVHQALCSTDTVASDRSEIAGMRRTVLAELGLTEADTNDMAKLLDLDMTDKTPDYFATGERPSAQGTARASSSSPIDQLYMLYDTGHWFYKTRWLVDVWGDAMTESARAAYVHQCIHELAQKEPMQQAVGYAWCSDDAHHIDRAKLAKELAPLSPDLRFVAKLEVANLMLQIAALDKAVAKDPHFAKIAIETPRKIADDWRAFAKAHRATIDHVRAVELAWIDGNGNAPETCRATLANDWKQAISAVKVVKTDAPSLGVASTSRLAYLASVGMSRCTAKLPGFTGLALMVGESLDRTPLGRGPRTEAFEAAVVELARTSKDKVEVPRMESVDVSFLPMQQSTGHSARFWAHTVASTEKHGDKIKFHFKKEKVDFAVCTKEAPTGNWVIHGNVIERETHCVAIRSESKLEAVEPVELPADLTSWVRAGNAIVMGQDDFPIEIWSDVHQTKLIGLYGTNRG